MSGESRCVRCSSLSAAGFYICSLRGTASSLSTPGRVQRSAQKIAGVWVRTVRFVASAGQATSRSWSDMRDAPSARRAHAREDPGSESRVGGGTPGHEVTAAHGLARGSCTVRRPSAESAEHGKPPGLRRPCVALLAALPLASDTAPLRRPCPSHPPGRPFDRRKSSRASPDVKLAHLGLRLCPLCSPHSWPATQGVMAGFDQKSNVVLSDSKERVYSMEDGVEEIPLGLYLVKGDQMCVPLFSPAALALLTVSHKASS